MTIFSHPRAPVGKTSVCAESVSAMLSSEYNFMGELNCLLTNFGPPLTAPFT